MSRLKGSWGARQADGDSGDEDDDYGVVLHAESDDEDADAMGS